jgi:hypothetical protein
MLVHTIQQHPQHPALLRLLLRLHKSDHAIAAMQGRAAMQGSVEALLGAMHDGVEALPCAHPNSRSKALTLMAAGLVLLRSCVNAGRFASVFVLWLLKTVRIWVITGTSLPAVNLHTATPMSRLLLRAPLTSKACKQQQQ